MYEPDGFILLPVGGYCFGVEAGPKDGRNVELHGGFATSALAEVKKQELLAEFDDYEYVQVVRIETPKVESRPDWIYT